MAEGFHELESNRQIRGRKRKYEGKTSVLEWEHKERPSKVPILKMKGFKEYFTFEQKGDGTIEALAPKVELRKRGREFEVMDSYFEYKNFKRVRITSREETRKTKWSGVQV